LSSHVGHAPSGNGGSRYQNEKVRVAIIGVGNCANAFVQGVHHYRDADPSEAVPGLMHVDLGGYHVRDIEFSAAFDIDSEKVGKDLSEAIWSGQNNTIKFTDDIPHLGVPVQRGMTHDGLGKYLKEKITKAEGSTVDIAQVLRDTKTDVVVSYTRARAEALGVECKVGIADRAVRVVILSAGLVFFSLDLLAPAVYVLAALSTITVFQRIWHVRKELTRTAEPVSEL
jgi:myo-inositol-1-phosphate synthase